MDAETPDISTADGAVWPIAQVKPCVVREAEIPGPQPCELRWERPVPGDPCRRREIVCMAACGKRLAVVGDEESVLRAACTPCPIPREIARRPCLYLVPFKTDRDGHPRDYFACRWFYTLKPENPATGTEIMCDGCPYWFPRPPLAMVRDLSAKTERIIQYHQDAWAGRLPPSSLGNWVASWPTPKPQLRGLLRRLMRWAWSGVW